VETLSNSDEEKVSILSDIETVLTSHSKTTQTRFTEQNGWLQTLRPFVTLKMSVGELYECFRTVCKDYIPRDCGNDEGLPFHILRLLLLYHEPQLSTFLESRRVKLCSVTRQWVKNSSCFHKPIIYCTLLYTVITVIFFSSSHFSAAAADWKQL